MNSSQMQNRSKYCIESKVVTESFLASFIPSSCLITMILCLISVIFQFHVLCRAYLHIRGSTADKCLHVFLFSMTSADFILTGLCYPLELAQQAQIIPLLPYGLNLTIQLICWISLISSAFSLVFMNLDKLAYFRFPLSVACWLFGTAYTLVSWLNDSFICSPQNCLTIGVDKSKIFVYIGSTLLSSVLPTITSLCVALYILNIMTTHQKQIKQDKLLCTPDQSHGRQNSVFLARMRTFYFVFMTTVFTAITLLPYRFISVYRITIEDDNRTLKDCSMHVFSWSLIFLIYLNSIINPLLTITILPQYRLQCMTRLHYQMQPSLREVDSTRESI